MVQLLWTGGWDSTYRLLQLLFVLKSKVTTHYVIDLGRPSWAVEIQTLYRIKSYLKKHHPEAYSNLGPTRICCRDDLVPNSSIHSAFTQLRCGAYLGPQYEWLARYAAEYHLAPLELSIHRDDKAHAILEPFVTCRGETTEALFVFKPGFEGEAAAVVFGAFAFPLFETTKLQMEETAAALGWNDLLEMTHFCHIPLRGGRPCGTCNPCQYTIEEGLGRRVGFRGLARYRFRRLLHRVPGFEALTAARAKIFNSLGWR